MSACRSTIFTILDIFLKIVIQISGFGHAGFPPNSDDVCTYVTMFMLYVGIPVVFESYRLKCTFHAVECSFLLNEKDPDYINV